MAIEGLTQQQSDFIERFLKVPRFRRRQERKQKRRDAVEQFRLFNAERALLREDVLELQDAEVKAVLLARLSQADQVIEADPDNLDFAGGQAQLARVARAVQTSLMREQAGQAYAPLKARVDNLTPQVAQDGAQSDISLTWRFIEEKYEAGIATSAPRELGAALRAMARLEGMLDIAEAEAANPFVAPVGQVAVPEGLSEAALDARRRLSDTFNQLSALRDSLEAQFGAETVPLALRMGMSRAQTKLDTAVDAAPGDLPGLAEEAADAYDAVRRDGQDMLRAAGQWAQDHEAFLVRYRVMQAHPKATDTAFVKPEFDKITAAYDAAKDKAAAHEYLAASQDLSVLRHDLKDALDFADDCARFDGLYAERQALLATLPNPEKYAIDRLRGADADARAMLGEARELREHGQMTAGLVRLNDLADAVAGILDDQRFARQYQDYGRRAGRYLAKVTTDFDADVATLLADDLAYVATARAAAEADAQRGAYRSAAGQAASILSYARGLENRAAYLRDYLTERSAFAARLAEALSRAGPEGGIAIEGYVQALRANEAKRASAEATGDFRVANALCLRLKDEHAAKMAVADDAKVYLQEKVAFDAAFAELSEFTMPSAEAAKATAMQMLSHAVDASTRGNWLAGASHLRNAVLDIRLGISDAQTEALIDGVQEGGPKLTTPDTEFDAAFAVFSKVLDHVNALDQEDEFIGPLVDAELKAQTAEFDMDTDPAAAQKAVDEAIEDCREIARKLSAAARFAGQMEATRKLLDQAEQANAAGEIDAEIAQIRREMTDAEAAMAEPRLDVNAALGHLGTAQAEARSGLAAMALLPETLAPARQEIARAVALLSTGAEAPYLTSHLNKLEALQTEMEAAFSARDLTLAANKAAAAVEMASSMDAIHADCVEAVSYKASKLDGKLRSSTMTHATTVAEVAEINRLLQVMEDALTAGQFATALHTGKQARSRYFAARRKARAVDAFLPLQVAAREKLEALEPRAVWASGPAHEAVQTLRATFNASEDQAKAGNYHGAQKKLEGFIAACGEAAATLDLFDRCALLRTQAETAHAQIRARRVPAIDPLLARFEGKQTNAERKMEGFDFRAAADLFAELKQDCAAAEETLRQVDTLDRSAREILEGGDSDADGLRAAIGKAQAMLDTFKADPSAVYTHAEILAAEAQLRQAASLAAADLTTARADFEAAVAACTEIAVLMAQYDQLNAAAVLARTLAADLRDSHALRGLEGHETFGLEEIAGLMRTLGTAMLAARKSRANRPQTEADIEATIAALRDLRPVLDAHENYALARAPLDTRLADLEKGPQRHLIGDELTLCRRHLEAAETAATDKKHANARTELTAAGQTLDRAELRVMLATNTPPTPDDVAGILAAPDGLDTLDQMIAGLPPSTQRDVMAVAFTARFGCTLEMTKPGDSPDDDPQPEDGMDLPAPNLRRLYEEMSKLPPSDTLDNDSMLVFLQQSGRQTGSAYNPGKKKVLMREGDESRSHIYALAVEHELGTVDPDAAPKPGEERTAFSWNTLHEVGHAVDDKLGYMKQYGETLAGWKVYGANVQEAATEIAGAYGFDTGYVAEYMLCAPGRALPVPTPDGCDPEEWRRRMIDCRAFVDRARHSNNPWASNSVASACAVGDYTYVESYPQNWARYRTAERKHGVSGYQFRAPGEWFSELYAAFHSGRLNDSHKHRAIIADL